MSVLLRLPDGCPSCSTLTHPHDTCLDGGSLLAFYECQCGHRWKCWWHLGALDLMAAREAAA